jgi:hypothetical protein
MKLVYLASGNRTEGGKRTRCRPGTVKPSFREQNRRKERTKGRLGLLNLASENRTKGSKETELE